ncbi:hypothetical protein GGS20DRAFT_536609 [Poronia punctata]|nr:hypothetical protein GGS20DRAFT_536609 [Poronia punctata]
MDNNPETEEETQAQTQTQAQAKSEKEIFHPGKSWAINFYPVINSDHLSLPSPSSNITTTTTTTTTATTTTPELQFQPPKAGEISLQTFTVTLPPSSSSSSSSCSTSAAHIRLKIFRCDRWGGPQQWPHTFHARYDSETGIFLAVNNSPFTGGVVLETGRYFFDCEFYKGHGEGEEPDGRYRTGVFDVE